MSGIREIPPEPIDVADWRKAMVGVPAGPWRSSPWHVEEGPSVVYVKDGWVLCPLSSDRYADYIARCSPTGISALLDEIERLSAREDYAIRCGVVQQDRAVAAEAEIHAVVEAIGTTRFLDPPDGGEVLLAEQVRRMREALEKAEGGVND